MDSFLEKYKDLQSLLGAKGFARLLGAPEHAKVIFCHLFVRDHLSRPSGMLVLVSETSEEARQLRDMISSHFPSSLRQRFHFLPHFDFWGRERTSSHHDLCWARSRALSALALATEPVVLFTSLDGLLQRTIPRVELLQSTIELQVGKDLDEKDLDRLLEEWGYVMSPQVLGEGTIVFRGGILDIFCPNYQFPIRIELLGDEINSIRLFDPVSQESFENLDRVKINPSREFLLSRGERQDLIQRLYENLIDDGVSHADREGLLDAFREGYIFPGIQLYGPTIRARSDLPLSFLNPDTVLLLISPEDQLKESYSDRCRDRLQRYASDRDQAKPTVSPHHHFLESSDLDEFLGTFGRIEIGGIDPSDHHEVVPYRPDLLEHHLLPRRGMNASERFEAWFEMFRSLQHQEIQVGVLLDSISDLERMENLLKGRTMSCSRIEHLIHFWPKRDLVEKNQKVNLILGQMDGYILDRARSILLVSGREIFGNIAPPPKKDSQRLKDIITSFKDLKVDDAVVHVDHGISRYKGMKTIDVNGVSSDFLHLEFAGGDQLYLPVDRLKVLQKYSAPSKEALPRLDRLQGQSWSKRKTKAKKAAADIADKLLKMRTQRKLAQGISFSTPSDLYFEFESAFPYVETPDQLKAIKEVNDDLSDSCPMDRLVCGDVGFGKTEVALRAAMRVVLDGYQVLVVVPTTVLSYQHFRTFSIRFEEFGVSVGQVNRFIPKKQIRENLEKFKEHQLDILIGTHRALSKDVRPGRLGLLVIDEEQKFGVAHKETISVLSKGCEVLTLTATPIPRTLHLSMLGIRDISLIMTPPRQRLPIKTYVSMFDEELIREAVSHEIDRGGQVFFLHNQVESLPLMARMISELVPQAKVEFAHGQMGSSELERVMIDYLEGSFSVLACTTIIEAGLDIPNANTLIVNDADRFGLAQLYQIRGRIGRAARQGFCYFLHKGQRAISSDARKRLEVLTTYQDLGAGFHIASHDLDLRGAGDILGSAQSGHISGVGFELYTDLLEKSIRSSSGDLVEPEVEPEIKIPVSISIPDEYISRETDRLQLYKGVFASRNLKQIDQLRRRMKDRFGPPPQGVGRIFQVAKLKYYLRKLGATSLKVGRIGFFELQIDPNHEGYRSVEEFVKGHEEYYSLRQPGEILLGLKPPSDKEDKTQDKMLEELLTLVAPLSE